MQLRILYEVMFIYNIIPIVFLLVTVEMFTISSRTSWIVIFKWTGKIMHKSTVFTIVPTYIF